MGGSEAVILDIQRMSTEDGPGLRTTVFFKGCNLACPWCHNPESIGKKPDLNWFSRKCMGCNICQTVCPQKGISRGGEGVRFDRALCLACWTCVNECPNAAIELKGKPVPVEKLAAELLKDRAYFGAEGGVTLSGGEAMLQHEAVVVLARLLKDAGAHIAVDTAGAYDFGLLEAALPFIDMVLYDLKIFDGGEHKKFTGADNRLILENYRKLMERGVRVWVRTPVVEGATDSGENIAAIGQFIAGAGLPEKWELCAFNNLCRDKYERLDKEWAYKDAGITEKSHIEKLAEIAARYVPGAAYTGAVKDSRLE
jgi:pyruvate formate lyase activating enzyme